MPFALFSDFYLGYVDTLAGNSEHRQPVSPIVQPGISPHGVHKMSVQWPSSRALHRTVAEIHHFCPPTYSMLQPYTQRFGAIQIRRQISALKCQVCTPLASPTGICQHRKEIHEERIFPPSYKAVRGCQGPMISLKNFIPFLGCHSQSAFISDPITIQTTMSKNDMQCIEDRQTSIPDQESLLHILIHPARAPSPEGPFEVCGVTNQDRFWLQQLSLIPNMTGCWSQRSYWEKMVKTFTIPQKLYNLTSRVTGTLL